MFNYKIYASKRLYRLYMIEETIVFIVLIIISLFLFNLSEYIEKLLAYSIIGIIGIGVFFGLLASFIEGFNKIREKCKQRQEVKNEMTKKNNLKDMKIIKKKDQEFKMQKEFLRVQPFNSPYDSFTSNKYGKNFYCENGSQSIDNSSYIFDQRSDWLELPQDFRVSFHNNPTNSRDVVQDD